MSEFDYNEEDVQVDDTEATEKEPITEQELYDRLVNLFHQQLVLADDIAQLKKDAKFHKSENPKGLDKEVVSLASAAAKLEAAAQFEEFSAKNAAVEATFKRLSGYDE